MERLVVSINGLVVSINGAEVSMPRGHLQGGEGGLGGTDSHCRRHPTREGPLAMFTETKYRWGQWDVLVVFVFVCLLTAGSERVIG